MSKVLATITFLLICSSLWAGLFDGDEIQRKAQIEVERIQAERQGKRMLFEKNIEEIRKEISVKEKLSLEFINLSNSVNEVQINCNQSALTTEAKFRECLGQTFKLSKKARDIAEGNLISKVESQEERANLVEILSRLEEVSENLTVTFSNFLTMELHQYRESRLTEVQKREFKNFCLLRLSSTGSKLLREKLKAENHILENKLYSLHQSMKDLHLLELYLNTLSTECGLINNPLLLRLQENIQRIKEREASLDKLELVKRRCENFKNTSIEIDCKKIDQIPHSNLLYILEQEETSP